MDSAERRETTSQEKFLACKYDNDTCDIFVFLTKAGLRQLRSGGPAGKLTFLHEKTGAKIYVTNPVSVDSLNGELQVGLSIDPKILEYWVEISDLAYGRLQDGNTVMDRYDNGMGSKVFVSVDEEMVEMLTRKPDPDSSQQTSL